MQFKIPQNGQREDTIIGPITLRQLIILGIGGGIGYVIYLTLAKKYFIEIWLPPVLFVGLLTVAFAFVKIRNLSFLKYLLLLIVYNLIPRKRTWLKWSEDLFILGLNEPKKEEKKQ